MTVEIPAGDVLLPGDLEVPESAAGLIMFVHGSGSSRLSTRNRYVAEQLVGRGFGTLLFDLLTPEEDSVRANRFDIARIAGRLSLVTRWIAGRPSTRQLRLGYFGASTGAAAALRAAASDAPNQSRVRAIVSRGGRPDLAGSAVGRVAVPTLLIVGGDDRSVLELNRAAFQDLVGPKDLQVVPGAGHLFEEPGALETVSRLSGDWFSQFL